MRLNKFIAQSTGLSRRNSDAAISQGQIAVNGSVAELGTIISNEDEVLFKGKRLKLNDETTIMLNKPIGYVCSRRGQGSKTIYDLLPEKYSRLKPVGRLDKDSSGLILLTNNGELANKLTHPKFQKKKVYEVTLDKILPNNDTRKLLKGVILEDGLSKFIMLKLIKDKTYEISLTEGRNRQIRRTFLSLGYTVTKLHRTKFGDYELSNLRSAEINVT